MKFCKQSDFDVDYDAPVRLIAESGADLVEEDWNARHSIFAPIAHQVTAQTQVFAQNEFWQEWFKIFKPAVSGNKSMSDLGENGTK